MSQCRRLFFESQALCLQDLRQKVERTEHSDAKVLPLAEKVEKINQLKVRLPARLITQQLEPSHRLVDKSGPAMGRKWPPLLGADSMYKQRTRSPSRKEHSEPHLWLDRKHRGYQETGVDTALADRRP